MAQENEIKILVEAEVKRALKNLRKTQKELANLLGISKKTVESYEQGLRNIPSNIERILYFLLVKLLLISIRSCMAISGDSR